jgi:hypothetical protein
MVAGQYEKNPLLDIGNDGYAMVVEEFVQIPDESGNRPRINCLTYTGDRIFVSTEGGNIYEIIDDGSGTLQPELFFNVNDAIPLNTGRDLVATGNWHSGLRSIAFHPGFPTNGKFYTSVMEERPADTSGHHYLSDVDDPIEADGTLIEWTYDPGEEEVDENSYREVFRVGVPNFDHTIKQISFNRYSQPEDEDYGLLYISHGDGNIYYAPGEGGQNNDARGKIIRIDPLETDTTPYSVPASNPFVNDTSWLDELYATGMRNPHSLCFAEDDTGGVHLISANAGRDNIEEINVVSGGENHGWSAREGTYVQLEGGGINTGIEALPDNDADFGFTYPAAQWSHTDPVFSGFGGLSIAGGYVYTIAGTEEKIYLSCDFPESGIVMYNTLDGLLGAVTKLDPEDPDKDEPEELTQTPFKLLNVYFDDDGDPATLPLEKTGMLDVIDDDPGYDGSDRSDLRFGQDGDENIYITSKRNGWVYKIQSISPVAPNAILNRSLSNELTMQTYPNPVERTGYLNVSFNRSLDESAVVYLTSVEGRQVFSTVVSKGSSNVTIPLASMELPAGFYVLKVYAPSFTTESTIVVK